jgi:hypothetical protein
LQGSEKAGSCRLRRSDKAYFRARSIFHDGSDFLLFSAKNHIMPTLTGDHKAE